MKYERQHSLVFIKNVFSPSKFMEQSAHLLICMTIGYKIFRDFSNIIFCPPS